MGAGEGRRSDNNIVRAVKLYGREGTVDLKLISSQCQLLCLLCLLCCGVIAGMPAGIRYVPGLSDAGATRKCTAASTACS